MDNNEFSRCQILTVLPKKTWLEVADDLREASLPIAKCLLLKDHEGHGLQDAKEFLSEMDLAIQAMWMIAEIADKIKVLVSTDLPRWPWKKEG